MRRGRLDSSRVCPGRVRCAVCGDHRRFAVLTCTFASGAGQAAERGFLFRLAVPDHPSTIMGEAAARPRARWQPGERPGQFVVVAVAASTGPAHDGSGDVGWGRFTSCWQYCAVAPGAPASTLWVLNAAFTIVTVALGLVRVNVPTCSHTGNWACAHPVWFGATGWATVVSVESVVPTVWEVLDVILAERRSLMMEIETSALTPTVLETVVLVDC